MKNIIDHEHEICNENCPTKHIFNSVYKGVFFDIDKFIKMFHVPFEFNTEEKTFESLKNVNILFIDEAPGENEAKYKNPFYQFALSGKILRSAISDLNIKNYAIANIVGCRPIFIDDNGMFRNRTPIEEECNYCIDNLRGFIGLLNNNLKIILLGKTAAFSILKNIKSYIKDYDTITPLVKLKPLKLNGITYGANFHPRYIASSGGVKGKRYIKFVERIKVILNE